jgi:EAL domain-containing protein (putative c-di-GMP-specific phosphodiesterase class I)
MAPGQQVEIGDLPANCATSAGGTGHRLGVGARRRSRPAAGARRAGCAWRSGRRSFERILISRALAHTGGRRIEAAQALGIGRNTITRKIAELGIDGGHVHELLKRSDPVIRHLMTLLLERFRSTHPGLVMASDSPLAAMDQEVALRTLTLTRDLSFALENGQLELFYQPLVGFAERNLVGFEALVRWRHPMLGMIMPMEFIGLAEKTGLIHRLGYWVLEHAIEAWAELRMLCQPGSGLPPFVSINLSAAELGDPLIVETIRLALEKKGMLPQELKIELTETVVIEDRAIVGDVLEKLSTLGIAIALDDFGTGYAGLDYLKTLPISCLKIDKTFVQEMATSLRSYEIVQSAINLAGSIGLSTIAEGIEDEDTVRRLNDLGCNIAQGYYFARPMPAGAVAAWLKQMQADGRLRA